ncbi:MAG: tetratricopeptide repeat protein, partial [Myxococcales bacterium]|nr:tetratricopeptide repeat protein [Myxococcales bacterium]
VALNKNKVIAAAQRYTQKGQLDRAIREYKSIVEEDPEDVRIWLKIGDLYTRKGSISHAVQTYNRVAEHYRAKGFFLKAVAVYKSVLKIDPGYIDAHLALAEMYVKLGLVPDAIGQFQIVVGSYERTGRRRESLELLKRIVDIAPDDVSNRIRLAEGYAAQEEQEAAVAQFHTVLDQLESRQRLDDFVQVAERLLYLAPDEHNITRRLAQIYVKKGEPKRALARLQLLFRADPRDTETLALLAATFNSLGQTAKAVAVYRELARIFAEAGSSNASVAAYRKLLELEPGDAEALEATGRMGGGHGGGQSASADMSADLMTDDQKLARYIEDADLLVKYELTDHALERLRLAFEINPHHRGALTKQRDLFKRLGRIDDAVEALLHLARVDELTDLEAASAHLQEALALSPGHPGAAEHMDRLSRQSRPPMRPAAPEPAAQVLAPPLEPGYAPPPPTGGFELDLDGLDFDDGLDEHEMGEQPIELHGPEGEAHTQDSVAVGFDDLGDDPLPDDDPFGDLLAAEASDAAGDDFGDLLYERRDAEFGGLLVPDEPPEPSTEQPVGHLIRAARDDEFGDLLVGEPDPHAVPTRPTHQVAAELAGEIALGMGDDFAQAFDDLPPAGSLPDDDAFGDLLDDFDGAEAPAPPDPLEMEFGGSIDEPRGLDDSILSRPPGVIAPPPPAGVIITPPPPEPLVPEPPAPPAGLPEAEFDDFGDIDFGDLPPGEMAAPPEPPVVDLGDSEGLVDGFFDDLLHEAEEAERSLDNPADDEAALVGLSGFDLGDFHDAGPSFRAREEDDGSDLDAALDEAVHAVEAPDEGLLSRPLRPTPPPTPAFPPVDAGPDAFTDEEPSFEADLGRLDQGESLELLEDDDIELLDEDDLELVDDEDDGFNLQSAADFIEEAAAADAAGLDDAFDDSADGLPVNPVPVGGESVPPSAEAALNDLDLDGFDADDPAEDGFAGDDGFGADSAPAADFGDAGAGTDAFGDEGFGDGDFGDGGFGGGGFDDGDFGDGVPALEGERGSDDLFAADALVLDEAPAGEDGFEADDLVLGAEPADSDGFEADDLVLDEAPAAPLAADDLVLEEAPVGAFAADDLVLDEAPAADDMDLAGLSFDDPVASGASQELVTQEPFEAPEFADEPGALAADDLIMGEAGADPFASELALDDQAADEFDLDDWADEPAAHPLTGESDESDFDEVEPTPAPAPVLPPHDTASEAEPTAETPSPANALQRMAQRLATGPKPAAPSSFGFFDIAPSAPTPGPSRPAAEPGPAPLVEPAAEPFPELTTAANEPMVVGDATVVANLADLVGPGPDLSELDFMLETHLIDDARELLAELEEDYAGHPELAARATRLSQIAAEDAREDELIGGLFDDGDGDLGTIQGAQLSELSEDDANTHFDLGLAFKEMGQYRKAMEQLEKAARSLEKRAEALRVLGLCHLEQGQAGEAAARLEEALATPGVGARARVGLQYDLATAYEAQGRDDEAIEQLQAILDTGASDFLDVKDRLARLGA